MRNPIRDQFDHPLSEAGKWMILLMSRAPVTRGAHLTVIAELGVEKDIHYRAHLFVPVAQLSRH
jgi:hypothetical protein